MVMTDVEDRAKHSDLPVYGRLREVVCLVESVEPLYVRYSEDPRRDVGGGISIDGESGLPLPGLSASPLTPEPWWTRPVEQWAARQLMKYRHLEHEAMAASPGSSPAARSDAGPMPSRCSRR